jgi:NADPH:quinone reductase
MESSQIPKTMNSVVITSPGKYGFAQIPVPTPSGNMVLIKVEAATLNPSDILFMRGLYNVKLKPNYTPGWEGSGVVVQTGEGAKAKALLGKRVAFMKAGELNTYNIGGSFADYCLTHISTVFPISDDIPLEAVASFIVNPLTAVSMVDRIK